MGCYKYDSNRPKLSKLLHFTMTKSEENEISLDKYRDRMQESQESIGYMSGDLTNDKENKSVSTQKTDGKLDESGDEWNLTAFRQEKLGPV